MVAFFVWEQERVPMIMERMASVYFINNYSTSTKPVFFFLLSDLFHLDVFTVVNSFVA
jgi:hypothetical protein